MVLGARSGMRLKFRIGPWITDIWKNYAKIGIFGGIRNDTHVTSAFFSVAYGLKRPETACKRLLKLAPSAD